MCAIPKTRAAVCLFILDIHELESVYNDTYNTDHDSYRVLDNLSIPSNTDNNIKKPRHLIKKSYTKR
jgi:hypothetical protein